MSTLSGDTLRLTLFGRSHGPSVGMTLSVLPGSRCPFRRCKTF